MDNGRDETIENEDRGLPPVNKRSSNSTLSKAGLLLFLAFIALALVAVNGGFSSGDDEDLIDQSKETLGNTLPPLPAPPQPPKIEKKPPPVQTRPSARGDKEQEMTPERRKALSGTLVYAITSKESSSKKASASTDAQLLAAQYGEAGALLGGGEETQTALGQRLAPTQLRGASASIIQYPSFTITKGTFLDCALETALNSDVPGMTSCRLTRNVFSTNKKLLLLERGSRIVGEYKSNLKRGQARLFVLWTRIETPQGVIVNLDSPGTDALGRAGLSGHIDTHFWERFGAAIMLSLVDDVGAYISEQNKDSNGDTINFDSTGETAESAAASVVENSINLPPTLIKNQGDHINIFVARDLDFRGVYAIKSK